ncbi:zinc-binding dehydrogenase [Mycolicibacterium fluoranthenivorans]|uniref:Threonine dehydrogenase-like Zn-dependent dehydrogenase n=1 Tax=Mycolicibacterium fluoranthenivorans TaxID=258505 RepID=A0A7X5U0J6_9MYCO|nr:zinc-binding dehydrogenase [Mycolicibacterium fluoranthenivorans]NIH96171.1 threonine dehydrogenase-like Zn-dependent dehydrogenase [Mycolicibacterium fluoranthenivorans]
MRAVLLRHGELTVGDTPDPVPGPGELLLRTLSTAICASDVHFMDHPALADDPTGRTLYDAERDIVLGHEFVGEVIGHGPGCTDQFPVGTRVTSIPIRLVARNKRSDGEEPRGADGAHIIGQHPDAQGSFAEKLIVNEMLAKPVPGDVSDDAAALTDAFAVGEFYVRSAAIQPGEIAIVLGAGAVGLSAVAALHARGIEPIVVSDFQADRRALAEAFGAHVTVDPVVQSPFEVFRQLRAERHLPGPAIVFECVGAGGLIQHIVESVEMCTRIYCAGGWYTGDTLSITNATRQGVTIQFGGGPMPQDWYGTLDAIAGGRLDPLPAVGKIIGLDEIPHALDLARRSEGPPRILVHPNGDVQ